MQIFELRKKLGETGVRAINAADNKRERIMLLAYLHLARRSEWLDYDGRMWILRRLGLDIHQETAGWFVEILTTN